MINVSIIIPFNNGKKYLEKCLENLKKLKYKDYEIILIDDFSNDNSKDIIQKYTNKLNIKYYSVEEKTTGVGNARNVGIEKAKGKYIMFIDVDDSINENLIITLQKYMDKNIELIKYKMKIIEEGKESIKIRGCTFEKMSGEDGFNKLCFEDKFFDSPCLYLIKKELFIRTNLKFEKNVYHEDFGLIPQLIVNAKSIISVDYYGYNYIQSQNSIMRNNDYETDLKKVNDKFVHYDNMINNLEKYRLKQQTKENLKTYYTNSIIQAVKDLNFEDRMDFEKKIEEKELVENIKVKNIKQLIKKIILKKNMELYYKFKERNFT